MAEDLDRDWYETWDGLYGEIRLAQRCPACKGRNYPEVANDTCSVCNGFGWLLTQEGKKYRDLCRSYQNRTPCPHWHKRLKEIICPCLVRLAHMDDLAENE